MSKSPQLQLSIVIPIYNEEKSLASLIKVYKNFGKNYHFELICVNNGSNDGTGNILQQLSKKNKFIKIVTVKRNRGYGFGVLSGLKYASGDVIAWTHADMQTHPSDIFRAFEEYNTLNDKYVLVKGTRYGRGLIDTIISFCMGIIASVFLRISLTEINAQPKLFHKSFLPNLKHAPHDFSLDLYCLYKARKHNYTIVSIPVLFHKREYGKSKWAYSIRSRMRMMRNTFLYIYALSKQS